jgi:hypothetical protein
MLICFVLALLTQQALSLDEEAAFDTYFYDKVLRVDMHHFGNGDKEIMCIHGLKEEPHFSGPKARLIDDRGLGTHRFDLYDAKDDIRLYSRGFCTLFGEWKTTPEARRGIYRVFEHCLIMPYPKRAVFLSVSMRSGDGGFEEFFRQRIDLDKASISTDNPYKELKTMKILHKGDPHDKVDIVILGDGYGASEMKKFIRDARSAADELLEESPFTENRGKINFWAVQSPSLESGVDEPRKGSYKSTVFETSFNTFDLERYSMSMNIEDIHDAAACVPYDFILILFNAPRYGGGGIYNLYAMVTGSSKRAGGIIAHEMGHCLGGLADEYFQSAVTYVDFYPKDQEPWEPNITALLDPSRPKWAKWIQAGTPIPTPDQGRFDQVVGCFEGAGYQSQGLYRPCRNCIMRTCGGGFCPVCKAALEETIRFYAK